MVALGSRFPGERSPLRANAEKPGQDLRRTHWIGRVRDRVIEFDA
jgi:hypothetical protein